MSIETLVQDEAARELLALRGETAAVVWPHLVAYLGLFRSPSRALAWDRALRLAKEVLEIPAVPNVLATALAETVEAMRQKRGSGAAKPLSNHNYLKRVLESVVERGESAPVQSGSFNESPVKGKRAQAVEVLRQWAGDDWLCRAVAEGLSVLIVDNRKGAPGADTVAATAGLWEYLLRSAGCAVENIDLPRIQQGFKQLLKDVAGWPEGKELIARLPRRPHQERLPDREIPDEERARMVAKLREITESTAEGVGVNDE